MITKIKKHSNSPRLIIDVTVATLKISLLQHPPPFGTITTPAQKDMDSDIPAILFLLQGFGFSQECPLCSEVFSASA
jgi:hypothetical protein